MIWENVSAPVGSKQWYTRILCWMALSAVVAGVCILPVLGLAIFGPDADVAALVDWVIWPIVFAGAAWYTARIGLYVWRKCDRCKRRLFDEPGWGKPAILHHSAEPLLGRYAYGAMWQVIRRGSARCIWCGHIDGATPDYVVTSAP